MYLKSLEVHGFKSFAKKIVFDFHNGITGIVGPNGSGKSNVGDAVRWVFGEQSAKQLRGANMQDVIFSGTEIRKPLGFAYVAITLDNSDHQLPIAYDQVKVARKVYRSGESEYSLNGTACRLKDVQELFYDTGIGKEGYSLIGQGQIDRILSGRPEERRELFDEAAGIVKFKRRKKNAQKNLDNERQNLTRINDILSELEKQVGPLERQSQKAKTFLSKKEELKKYDVNLFLLEIETMKDQIAELEKKLEIAASDLEQTKQEEEASKQQYAEIEANTARVDLEIEQIKSQINDCMLNRQKLEGEINVLREQINAAANLSKQFEERRQSISKQLLERSQSQESNIRELSALSVSLEEMEQEKIKSESALASVRQSIEHLNQRIERSKNEIIHLLNEKAKILSGQERYDTMLEQIQIRKAQLNQKLLQIKSNEEQQGAVIAQHEQEMKEAAAEISRLTEQTQKEEHILQACQIKTRKTNADLMEKQENFHRQQSRLDSLINMTERYEGYGNAIRKVMEQKQKYPGLVGAVADILKTEKKYETAIETALGGSIQNIVTDTEDTARKMIDFLKQNRFGRATFLPLTSIQPKSGAIKKEVAQEEGVLGMAHELVRTKDIFLKLTESLLGRTVVVKTMNHAIALARKYKYTLRIVTLDGELLNPGGSMTGGAFKHAGNLLGRRREIEELKTRAQALTEEIEQAKSLLNEQAVIRQNTEAALSALKDGLQQAVLWQNTVKLNLEQASAKKDELKKDIHLLHGEGKEIETQIQEIGFRKKQIHEQAILTQNKVEEFETLTDEDQIELSKEQEKESQLNLELSKRQVSYASLKQRLINEDETRKRIEQETKSLQQELSELEQQFKNADKDASLKEQAIQEMNKQLQQYADEKKDQETRLEQLNVQKQQLLTENKSFFQKREELSKQESDLDKEVFRLSSQKEKIEENKELKINYMWEEYELSIGAALELKSKETLPAAALKKQIARLRGEIKELGNVNVNAIEEYKEISERYEFMNGQRNDLLEAEKTLIKIIAELDEGMRAQFHQQFALMQKEFDKVYKELFGGGRGSIELMDDDEDILEAGIVINSQPPGKKLSNMMQLSGGEKALTAIALLFAIQNLKPSPFCLLDEIEAALDDSNVERYAKYLNKLTKNTQFIIITHRRGTMAAADRLYGITMQEKGVSTLVSVNLIEAQLSD